MNGEQQFIKLESFKNGTVLGIALGAAILWGDKIREPLVNFLNGIIPEQAGFLGSLWAPIIILGVGALIGYWVDKT